MLPGYCNSNCFRLSFFVKDQVRYLVSQNGFSHDVSSGVIKLVQSAIESLKSIRRLTGELDLVIVMFKIKEKGKVIKLSFRIFHKLDGLGDVCKLGIFFFFGHIKRFESLMR